MGSSKQEKRGRGGRGKYHKERCALGDNCAVPCDILGAFAGQADGDDGPEAEGLLDESCDVGNLFFNKTFLPGVAIRVDFHDFLVCALLDLLATLGGEVGNSHDEVTRDGVKTSGNHSQTDRLDLSYR